MSCTTLLGVFPFLALLDDWRYDNAGLIPCFYAFAGGCLASMPSVNIRPCLINGKLLNRKECNEATRQLIFNHAQLIHQKYEGPP